MDAPSRAFLRALPIVLLACAACSGAGGRPGEVGSSTSGGSTAGDTTTGTASTGSPTDAGETGTTGGGGTCRTDLTGLLQRLSPSMDDLAALPLEEICVADDSWPALASLDLPDYVRIQLDPVAGGRDVGLCLDWGILTSGTMRLPTPAASAEFLGTPLLGPANPARGCGHEPKEKDIYGCTWTCWNAPKPIGSSQTASTPEDVDAFVDDLEEVRLLHPYMVAYPCAGATERTPQLSTDRAAIFTTQFATTGDGLKWADAFRESGTAGDNDVEGAEDTWHQAWEVAARHGAMVLWLGDVSFPRRWYPAAPRTADNPLGLVCDPDAPDTGWWTANDFTGLQFFALHVAAQAMGDDALPDGMLATFSAMPYVRALSVGATFLARVAEASGATKIPRAFSVAGASKGGMGCLYATVGDPRIEHGVCKVFDAFDTETGTDMMHRMVSDWGLCEGGGKRADGCATGNFPGFPGPAILPFLEDGDAAVEGLRDT
ncbi:MAG: hypothetical protein D6705_10670 [Deltaproteobacteria bacterium]|nr:MAG: hypothetical protein D6705_10670 [Deltaproteobacteria bacterium]